MAYVEKIPGNTCTQCREGKYVRNPKTNKVFCDKKCWLNVQNNQSGTTPSFQPENAPQSNFKPLQEQIDDLMVKIGKQNQTIALMRTAFQKHEDRLRKLEPFDL